MRTTGLVTAAKLALDSIRAHKLRSFLTLLGIIVGVASVILVGAAIDGLGAYSIKITERTSVPRVTWWRRSRRWAALRRGNWRRSSAATSVFGLMT